MDFLNADEQQNGHRLFALAIEQQGEINDAVEEYVQHIEAQHKRMTTIGGMIDQFAETKRLLRAHGNTPASLLSDNAERVVRQYRPEALSERIDPPPRTDLN